MKRLPMLEMKFKVTMDTPLTTIQLVVANTSQFVGAGETTMIMPQVAAVYQYMPTIMSDVNTNPYVGTESTIGTGQTEFSLAGLSSGALVL